MHQHVDGYPFGKGYEPIDVRERVEHAGLRIRQERLAEQGVGVPERELARRDCAELVDAPGIEVALEIAQEKEPASEQSLAGDGDADEEK